MKKTIILITLLISQLIQAQTTAIPDINFELTLIDLGLDDVQDGTVLTANINSVTNLDIWGNDIADLTGIEDFIALQILDCSDNLLSNIDISNNLALTELECSENQLTSLNVNSNTNLINLYCEDNQLVTLNTNSNTVLESLLCDGNLLTSLDVSNNLQLVQLWCDFNQITVLDLSANTALYELFCGQNNSLSNLNIKNGANLMLEEFDVKNTPSLTCIQVDDEVAATEGLIPPYNVWLKDSNAIYSEDCATASTTNFELTKISIFPNPVKDEFQIDLPNNEISKVEISNYLGQKVLTKKQNSIDISNFNSGIYFVKISTINNKYYSVKIIKE